MQAVLSTRKYKRQIVVIALIMILTGGVIYAIMQSKATISGSSISTVNSSLLVSSDSVNYAASAHGFNFSGIVPGARDSQTEHFVLKNAGETALGLRFSAEHSAGLPADADLSNVNVILTPHNDGSSPGAPQSFALSSLLDSDASGGMTLSFPSILSQTGRQGFDIRVSMGADSYSGQALKINGMDLVFTGLVQS